MATEIESFSAKVAYATADVSSKKRVERQLWLSITENLGTTGILINKCRNCFIWSRFLDMEPEK